jgi:hypothetical protein
MLTRALAPAAPAADSDAAAYRRGLTDAAWIADHHIGGDYIAQAIRRHAALKGTDQ